MGTTGLIYVAIVAAWAAYLVPMLLRRSDEVVRRHAAEQYSAAHARVLSRQGDDQSGARYVVKPPTAAGAHGPPDTVPERYIPNRARRVAAMRRRRVLSILTLSLLSVAVLAIFAMLPWLSVAIPVVLIAAFVTATRIQLRRDARRRAEERARGKARAVHDHGPGAPSADAEATVEVELPAVPEAAVMPAAVAPDPPAEGLWDPVPVTLPTYVLKEKAPDRTVRTISLSGPEVFSSARAVEPEVDAAPVAEEADSEDSEELEIRRAVGD